MNVDGAMVGKVRISSEEQGHAATKASGRWALARLSG
jgi:hypothetical protein